MAGEVFRCKAPAKINLYLDVGGRRADGFHEIRTVYQSIGLFDELFFERRKEGVDVECDASGVPSGEDNLVFRAAKLLLETTGKRAGAKITLKKKIPQKAGLGGGSSDAGATLIALNSVWKLGLRAEELLRLAEKLGSDVPFFLTGGTALGVGRGEETYPLPDAPKAFLVLGFPEEGISTKEAYERIDEVLTAGPPARRIVEVVGKILTGSLMKEDLYNRFEDAIPRSEKVILSYRKKLISAGAEKVMLSGSGSAWFGYFGGRGEALAVRGRIPGDPGKWAIAPTLNRKDFVKSITPTTMKKEILK